MVNTAHLIETALLLLAAYLLGCVLGYGMRLVLHAGRGTRRVTPAIVPTVAPVTRRQPSPAARLAARVDEPPARTVPEQPKRAMAATSSGPKPAALSGPRAGAADNLKQIKGIGPKIEAALNGLGIYHFDQIALWSKANVDWVDGQLAFKGRIRRERWVEQATEMMKAEA